MKRTFTCMLFSLCLTAGITQPANYKVVYRHCLQINDDRILTDTLGVEAVLTGNAVSSNYRFGIITPALKARAAEENNKNPAVAPDRFAEEMQAGATRINLGMGIAPDTIGTMVFWDRQTDSIFVREKMLREYVLTREKRSEIEWQLVPGTRQILQYQCSKATTEFRGRKYTAWFAPEIAIPEGPWKFKGLPGLILSLEDENYQVKIYASSVETSAPGIVSAYQPLGRTLSLPEYMRFFNEELREQTRILEESLLSQQGNGFVLGNLKLTEKTYHKIEKKM